MQNQPHTSKPAAVPSVVIRDAEIAELLGCTRQNVGYVARGRHGNPQVAILLNEWESGITALRERMKKAVEAYNQDIQALPHSTNAL